MFNLQLTLITLVGCTLFVQTSAYCRFLVVFPDGYLCMLENVNVTSYTDMIDLSGDHIGGRTNEHVTSVFVVQTSILIEIPTIIFLTFGNLEQLTVNGNHISRIYLPYCGPRMRELSINFNSINTLQNGAFIGCRTIIWLTLWRNNIKLIEANVFDDLPRLLEFSTLGNPLVEIRGNWFRYQHQIQVLTLVEGEISSIPPGAFQCKEFLHNLSLRNNKLSSIVTGTFTNMPRLRRLDLSSNYVRSIEDGAFANLPLLETLELSENEIVVFDSRIFGTSFSNLFRLDVGSSHIDAIDRHVFRRFPALTTFVGASNVCFSNNFFGFESLENDVFPHLEICFRNFDDL